MKNGILNFYKENRQSIKVYGLCIMIGIIAGILVFLFLPGNVKNEFKSEIINVLEITKDGSFETVSIVKNGLVTNIIIISIIFFISLTIIAPFMLCVILIIKGLSIGIYISTLYIALGTIQGTVAVLLLVLLPSVLIIGSYIYISVQATNFYYNVVTEGTDGKLYKILKYLYKLSIAIPIIVLSIILEEIFSKIIISIYKGV